MLSLCKANILYQVPKLVGAGIWIVFKISSLSIIYQVTECCCIKVSL